MIPIKIQIKNFLSYGNDLQTVDFSPYHLLCLSGKNGHGKSALLDAITWAVWGQARKTSNTAKADHGLLRLGQTHMLVILDFECNNAHYRIRREFALTYGKPYAAIDFGIVDEASNTIAPLTEKTIRGTQQKIEDTLHLSYDAFINSAFLRQGQANEFSKKSAKDRKEILANILGLQRYENMRKLANEQSRQAAIQKQQLLAVQENSARELEKTELINQQLIETDKRIELHAQEEAQISHALTVLQKERDTLIQQQEAKNRIIKDIADLTHSREAARTELRTLIKEWRTIHAQQLNSESPESLKKEHLALTQTLQVHQETLAKKLEKKDLYLKEKEHSTHITHSLKAKQQELIHAATLQLQQLRMMHAQQEQQHTSLQKTEQNLQKSIFDAQLEINLRTQEIADFPTELLAAQEKQFEKRRTHYQQWIAQANLLKNELDQLQQKKLFAHSEDDTSACPLCEQNLSAARKKFLKTKLSKEEQFLFNRYNRLSKLIRELKPILVTQHEHVHALKNAQTKTHIALHQKTDAEKKLALLHAELTTCTASSAECLQQIELSFKKITEQENACKTLQETIEQQITQDPTYIKQQNILKDIEQQYTSITYDAQTHKQEAQRLQEIAQKLLAYETLQHELRMQQERQRIIHASCIMLKKMNAHLITLHKQLHDFDTLEEQIKNHAIKERAVKERRDAANKLKETLLHEKGQYTQHLSMLAKIKNEHAKYALKIKELTETVEDYQTIATALGKNGIQALLIEDAIPEIEHEANDLLGKLTDNQAHISIESLRDLKSGGTAETLDIKISDAAGIRPYELFSGGEAFRIDFALRIAISKLLARRAGTSLQTLIIDEGFGSQDDDGLSYIMDALYKIQDDFKKVIIVSHLPRLKDQFPVHFCVQKGPGGSTVHIVEQA
jgi:exonuclease SbcC